MTNAKNAPDSDSYVSARPRALAVQGLVIVQLLMMGFTTINWVVTALSADRAGIASATALTNQVNSFQQLCFWIACIPFLMWVHRSVSNLPPLGSMNRRFTPSQAVTGFIIPFVNLVRSWQTMAMIWTESQPALLDDKGVPQKRKTALVNWWWGLYLAQVAVPFLLIPMLLSSPNSHAIAMGLFYAVQMSVAVMFLVVISATQRRQDAMWDDLQRQRNVPQPTAEYLR